MRRFIYYILVILLTLLPECISAATMSGAKYTEVKITYQSVDAHNNPVTLSAVLYYPMNSNIMGSTTYKTIKYIFLNNHATITDDASSPSGGASAMGQVSYMTSEDALVVCPDYIGFGATKNVIHPYMAQTLTARNVVDCMKAAIDDAKTKTTLAENYYTINCGYSQGGGVTMAVARYLETEADEATQRLINLRGSICGAGCYNQSQILADYENRSSITYPIYLPYLIQGMFEVYGEGCLRGLTLEDCFTKKFWESGILNKLNEKNTDVDALNSELISYMGGNCTFYDIVNADFSDHNSVLYRTLYKAICKNDLITDDWTPQHPIVFYHYTQDEVVPYAGTELAMSKWGDTGMVSLKKAEDITNYGAWQLAFLKYPNLKQNHRDYGTCFYLAVFDDQLLPPQATDGFISTQARTGVDRNDMDCTMTAGQWALVSFPSEVDGYYFGANAERYLVSGKEKKDEHYTVRLEPMDDTADFEAGKDYLVCPTVEITNVVSITAGLPTPKTDAAPLITNQLAATSTLTQVGTFAYSTLYSAFDVQVPTGIRAYTAHLQGDKMHLTELTQGIIPAKTGVVLKSDESGEILLQYSISAAPAEESDLTGTLTDIPNPGHVLTLGTNSTGNLGFYTYNGTTLAATKAYYQPATGNEAKALSIILTDDQANHITTVESDEQARGYSHCDKYSLDGMRINNLRPRLNIVKDKNGVTRKVWVK